MDRATRAMSAEALLRLPRDGWRYELIAGELRRMTPSGFRHGAIVMNLSAPLFEHVRERRLGIVCGAETGFLLRRSPDTVRAPDIGFVRQERVDALGVPAEFWPGPPDLAIEVMSPSDSTAETNDKAREWLVAGAAVVWVVNVARRTVTVCRSGRPPRVLSESDVLSDEEVVAGFEIRVGELFHGIEQ